MTYYPPNPTIETEIGTERLCRGCGEFWPIDDDFWYFQDRGGRRVVMGRCRACWSERSRDAWGRRKHRELAS